MTEQPQPIAFKTRVKHVLQRTLPTSLPPVIVASMGRSGSTLVHDALCQAVTRARFPAALQGQGLRIVTDQAWDLDARPFAPGIVYKTHGLAEELPDHSGAKVVFLFGSATDAALSVLACRDHYGDRWIRDHFAHLRASGPFEELGDRDVLRFGDQLDGWIGKTGTPRMILHYDALWDTEEALSRFVGVPVTLPARRARSGATAADAETRARFAASYAELDARIAALPRCQVLS
ncbi:hypothetical protein roselon_01350 [Roseibacterium elongatum DSM 19469]|uniref:Sulfotransferase family protein n=1 Tax=Roseicyclus elongatus DSM 19469 TaxID=1294273 RepID=W8RRM0_9RHOB|nr:hypothetical protein [Roseibacterium elongatum]AHM03738.1 hypothetical protein roselon_01350 [Roseibacterium elongatum DSM 19469]